MAEEKNDRGEEGNQAARTKTKQQAKQKAFKNTKLNQKAA